MYNSAAQQSEVEAGYQRVCLRPDSLTQGREKDNLVRHPLLVQEDVDLGSVIYGIAIRPLFCLTFVLRFIKYVVITSYLAKYRREYTYNCIGLASLISFSS